ncbi:hypothetical protein NDU88_010841 [Pleurodeles waltl]|uniref:Uncharacterized protein n=1 Tax=Pleurodeles waltl TaxID=8319 RepID=A0AAV7PZ13_PLEWA|nr:hypothetical protein NDU88_010841 [Pleurodeles waltl]
MSTARFSAEGPLVRAARAGVLRIPPRASRGLAAAPCAARQLRGLCIKRGHEPFPSRPQTPDPGPRCVPVSAHTHRKLGLTRSALWGIRKCAFPFRGDRLQGADVRRRCEVEGQGWISEEEERGDDGSAVEGDLIGAWRRAAGAEYRCAGRAIRPAYTPGCLRAVPEMPPWRRALLSVPCLHRQRAPCTGCKESGVITGRLLQPWMVIWPAGEGDMPNAGHTLRRRAWFVAATPEFIQGAP